MGTPKQCCRVKVLREFELATVRVVQRARETADHSGETPA
jgi:hypothetical protein